MLNHEGCVLRQLRENDLGKVLEWRNSDAIRRNMYTDRLITWEQHLAWFQAGEQAETRRHLLFLYNDQPLGTINISDIDPVNRRCCWGFYIGEPAAPRGAGMAMGYLGIEYMFGPLVMHKICSEAFVFNAASIGYHKKLGFVEEGRFKEHVLKNGQYEDIICFALLRRSWDEQAPTIRKLSFEGGN